MRNKTKNNVKRIFSYLLILTLFVVNSHIGNMQTQAATANVKKIVLNCSNTSMSIGDTLSLKVKGVTPKNASKNVTWVSSNKKIATVTSKGKVKAIKNGTVTITAKSKQNSKVTAKCKIKVYKPTKKIKLLSEKSYILKVGQTQQLSAKVEKPKKGAQPVIWSSSNDKIASVNSKGYVTAVSEGITTVIGKSGKKMVKVNITVEKVTTMPSSKTPQQPDSPTVQNPTSSNENISEDSQTNTYNRSQWVALLVDKMKYSVSEEMLEKDAETGNVLYSYEDISGDKNALKIEAAAKYGIISIEDENSLFLPKELVTREFAAMTAVRAIGYITDMELECSDSTDLRYPKEDKVAIDEGIFSLIEGAFCPAVVASNEELESIIKIIEKEVADRTIDPNHEDVLVYTDAVVEAPKNLTNYTVALAEESSDRLLLTLPTGSEINGLEVGKIIVLPANEIFTEGFPFKIESMVTIGEQIVLTGQLPEDIFEVYETVNIQGYVLI